MDEQDQPTAGLLLIGDELLSGRTRDKNFPVIAEFLSARGVDLCEVRVVPDKQEEIIAAVDALRHRYSYVLTTGGIGPTHDDITADAIAAAFGVEVHEHPDAAASLMKLFAENGVEPNAARMRMARVPVGARLITSDKIKAPGFNIGNVFVMAGVPQIMVLMLEAVGLMIEHGQPMLSRSVRIERGEGDLAGPLKSLQEQFPDVSIGSYPFKEGAVFGANIVMRSRDEGRLEKVYKKVQALV